MGSTDMIEMRLGRIVIRDDSHRQFIYLVELAGERGFPIVIGSFEAFEIHRVIKRIQASRPLTHELTTSIIEDLGGHLQRIEVTELREGTFYARLVLQADGRDPVEIDARPSDAIAIALRAGAPLFVAESVLEQACGGGNGGAPGA